MDYSSSEMFLNTHNFAYNSKSFHFLNKTMLLQWIQDKYPLSLMRWSHFLRIGHTFVTLLITGKLSWNSVLIEGQLQ